MPELPEVTTVIEILKTEILNKTINKIDILYPNTIKSDITSFENDLINKTILDITRLGKFIIFHLKLQVMLKIKTAQIYWRKVNPGQ